MLLTYASDACTQTLASDKAALKLLSKKTKQHTVRPSRHGALCLPNLGPAVVAAVSSAHMGTTDCAAATLCLHTQCKCYNVSCSHLLTR
jgi:hypothetical protein